MQKKSENDDIREKTEDKNNVSENSTVEEVDAEEKDRVKELEKRLEEKHEECEKYKDKYLRALASYENLRKRTRKEKSKIQQLSIENVIRNILPILDDFSRAFTAIEEEDEDDNHHFIEGVRMIHSKLNNFLRSYDVEPFDSRGEKFDPSRHEAIHVVEDEEDDDIIKEEIEKGYMIGDKVLRPAKVVVSRKKDANKVKKEDIQNKEVDEDERASDRD